MRIDQVLWVTPLGVEKDWEVDYSKELLPNIPFITVKQFDQVMPNSLIFINHNVNYMAYLSQYEERQIPFYVFHLSDEWMDDDYSFYNFTMCKKIFRNYYHQTFERFYPKINFIPLGYKRGFWDGYNGPSPLDIHVSERNYVWSFAGAPRSKERQDTIQLFVDKFSPHHLHWEHGNSFSDPKTGLSTEDFRGILLNSKFGLCPIGISKTRSGETGRIGEVLETGGIPIVLSGDNDHKEPYWFSLYGRDPPFVVGQTWDECVEQVQELLDNPTKCEDVRQRCWYFWKGVKKDVTNKLFC